MSGRPQSDGRGVLECREERIASIGVRVVLQVPGRDRVDLTEAAEHGCASEQQQISRREVVTVSRIGALRYVSSGNTPMRSAETRQIHAHDMHRFDCRDARRCDESLEPGQLDVIPSQSAAYKERENLLVAATQFREQD